MSSDWAAALADPGRLRATDPGDMLGRLAAFPAELAAAASAPPPAGLPAPPARVLLGGMGGSAIAGDLVAGLLREKSPLPLAVVRDYALPATGPGDLLVLCSYSGNTEETLSLAAASAERGLPTIRIASGGRLVAEAPPGTPCIEVPGGSPPRAALPSLLGKLAGLLAALGEGWDPGLDGTGAAGELAALAADCAPERPLAGNPAKSLALALGSRRAIFVAVAPAYAAVGLRLRGQMEENAKRWAVDRALPELHHNSWVPWREDEPIGLPLWLGESDAHPRVAQRLALSRRALAPRGLEGLAVPARGGDLWTRVLTTLLLGDFLSVYHALMRGVDPSPVRPIDAMKAAMAAEGEAQERR